MELSARRAAHHRDSHGGTCPSLLILLGPSQFQLLSPLHAQSSRVLVDVFISWDLPALSPLQLLPDSFTHLKGYLLVSPSFALFSSLLRLGTCSLPLPGFWVLPLIRGLPSALRIKVQPLLVPTSSSLALPHVPPHAPHDRLRATSLSSSGSMGIFPPPHLAHVTESISFLSLLSPKLESL